MDTLKKSSSDLLNDNLTLKISYNEGSIGLENHTISSISICLSNGISTVCDSIISAADKCFGDIDIKEDYINDYLENTYKMKSDINRLLFALNEKTLIQQEKTLKHNLIVENKSKLSNIANYGCGVLSPFINKDDYFLILSPVNSDYLFYVNNNLISTYGRRYNFGISVKISEDNYKVELYGRPTNACGLSLNVSYFNISEIDKLIKFIESYSTENAIKKLVNDKIDSRVIYS